MSKAIVVTGGARGIGAAAVRLSARRGWSVIFSYRNDDAAAEKTTAEAEAGGGKAIAVKSDSSREDEVIALFDQAIEAFGPIDGVVNNAGILSPMSPIADMTADRMRHIFDVNILGSYFTAREAARRMSTSRGGRGGSIVNLSSAAAKLGAPNQHVDYAGSKGAMESMTIGLCKELGPEGIRVNAIRPGLILTDMHASGGDPGRAERLAANVPMQRPGTADEVGEAIVWLLSDSASYVSGAILDVTGGR
ncbi:MAG: SDR family oxidoreductase [Bauldia sp.]|uniref:SDR family oxidoreductase n=1 Tax=Bauldia sp. TaxID=2575872 RepID=UPI001DEF1012|nr:SDR family oxidoreductase [Bauldia sp.]MCB1497676.1 SDR family oxidoreductase [Bauldia sp.]